jgi:hypothetical protein
MPEPTLEPDSTGGEKPKKKISIEYQQISLP